MRDLARALLAATLLTTGCGAFRPMARTGHDLVENPGRSALVRLPAGIGAIIGHAVAAPFGILLFPTYFFDGAVVRSSDGYWRNEKEGDIRIPLALAPFEYASGTGAAILGKPFDFAASGFREHEPGPPPGAVEEVPEPAPGERDPKMSFAVHPPPRPPAPPPPAEAVPAPAAPAPAEPPSVTPAPPDPPTSTPPKPN